jgi:hypothetical protein
MKFNNDKYTLLLFFEKNKKGHVDRNIWKRRLVFFDLPYWSNLNTRYCLNVMHVEKNMCDSLIKTLLKIPVNTNYSKNSCLDMVEMSI